MRPLTTSSKTRSKPIAVFPVIISWFLSLHLVKRVLSSLSTTQHVLVEFIILSPQTFDDVGEKACCVREASCRLIECKLLFIYKPIAAARFLADFIRLLAFSGRPMIECSECLTWIHLSCAKIRKSNVPDVFICQKCRDAKHTMRRSNRVRTQPKTKAINFKP